MITKDDIGPIKIKEFDRGKGTSAVYKPSGEGAGREQEAGDHSEAQQNDRLAKPPKIIDYDQERAEQALRDRVGAMKIVDVDREAKRERELDRERARAESDRPVGKMKIIESDP